MHLFLSLFFSARCHGLAATFDCGTPWTFRLTFEGNNHCDERLTLWVDIFSIQMANNGFSGVNLIINFRLDWNQSQGLELLNSIFIT